MSVKLRYRESKRTGLFSAYLDIYQNYKREYEYLDIFVKDDYTKTKRIKPEDKEKVELANNIRLKRELALKEGKHGFGNKHFKKIDFMSYFTLACEKKEHHSYYNVKTKLENYLGEGKKLSFQELDESRIKDFIKFLLQSVSENTAFHYLKVLNVVLNQAVREKIIIQNPINFLHSEEKPKKNEVKREFLTIEELKKLYKEPFDGNQQIKVAFLFSCYTGLRISDLKRLTWSKIDKDIEEIQYRQKKSSKEFHYLPIADSAREIIKKLPKGKFSDYVFWNLPASGSHTNSLIRIWAAKAGIKKHIHWHCGRHTYACLLLANGVDIYTVSKLLGHSSVRITEIYGKIIDETKKKAVKKLPSLI